MRHARIAGLFGVPWHDLHGLLLAPALRTTTPTLRNSSSASGLVPTTALAAPSYKVAVQPTPMCQRSTRRGRGTTRRRELLPLRAPRLANGGETSVIVSIDGLIAAVDRGS